jgi:hypothetical protein
MVLTDPFTIHVKRPAGTLLGDIMSEARSWLDKSQIEPVECTTVVNRATVGFQIRFRNQNEADLY